jgi:hypothetical protein
MMMKKIFGAKTSNTNQRIPLCPLAKTASRRLNLRCNFQGRARFPARRDRSRTLSKTPNSWFAISALRLRIGLLQKLQNPARKRNSLRAFNRLAWSPSNFSHHGISSFAGLGSARQRGKPRRSHSCGVLRRGHFTAGKTA